MAKHLAPSATHSRRPSSSSSARARAAEQAGLRGSRRPGGLRGRACAPAGDPGTAGAACKSAAVGVVGVRALGRVRGGRRRAAGRRRTGRRREDWACLFSTSTTIFLPPARGPSSSLRSSSPAPGPSSAPLPEGESRARSGDRDADIPELPSSPPSAHLQQPLTSRSRSRSPTRPQDLYRYEVRALLAAARGRAGCRDRPQG